MEKKTHYHAASLIDRKPSKTNLYFIDSTPHTTAIKNGAGGLDIGLCGIPQCVHGAVSGANELTVAMAGARPR